MGLLGVWEMRRQSQNRSEGWCCQGSSARGSNWSWQERKEMVESKWKDKTRQQQESQSAKAVSNYLIILIFWPKSLLVIPTSGPTHGC